VKQHNEAGFTMVELMIAVVVLVIGVVALAGTSAFVTRQIGRSRIATIATEVGTRRLEQLKLAAAPTGVTAACASAAFASSGAPITERGVTESWTVNTVGTMSTATVTVSYPRRGGTSTITLQTLIGCY
jgi:prepilin-type N-terminal cleavage/methylation domain-containing protein